MTLEELSVEYDRFYEEADALFRKYNPCQFEGNQCARNRKDLASGHFRAGSEVEKNGCCGTTSCKHLTPEGCNAKSLGCKLHTCTELTRREHRGFHTKLVVLRYQAEDILGIGITQCFWEKERYMSYLKTRGAKGGIE